jgi:hypothetical protein
MPKSSCFWRVSLLWCVGSLFQSLAGERARDGKAAANAGLVVFYLFQLPQPALLGGCGPQVALDLFIRTTGGSGPGCVYADHRCAGPVYVDVFMWATGLVLSYTRLVLGERSPLGRAAALLARCPPPTTSNLDLLCGSDRHPSSPFALSGSSVGQRGIFAQTTELLVPAKQTISVS